MLVVIFVGGSVILFFGVLTSVTNAKREHMTREQRLGQEYYDTIDNGGGTFF